MPATTATDSTGPDGRPFHFQLAARACPICAATEGDPFAPANFDPAALDSFAFASRKLPEYMHYALVVCRRCDLLYSNPAPTRQTLEQAYRDASFDASDESRYASVTYGSFLPGIAAGLPDRVGALDIGTGDGAFLEQLLAHGFTGVAGVEPSSAPVAAAKPAIRPLIRHGAFRAADFQAGRFRLVTCFQTIEHVFDPMQLCRDAFDLLQKEGAFFVVCHNRRAALARAMGLKSPIFDIEHLQLFSPKSIRAALTRAGFTRVEVRPVVNRYPLNYWARLFPLPAAWKSQALSLLRSSGLGRVQLSVPVGNLAAIAYK